MNIDDLKNTWQKQNNDNAYIEVNQKKLCIIEQNNQMKTFAKMKVFRLVEGMLFLLVVVALWQYIADDFVLSAPKISAIILVVFATIGLAGNIGQFALISKVDYSKSIKAVQNQIYLISSHKLQLTRLAILSVPFYMAYVFLAFDIVFGIDLFSTFDAQVKLIYSITTLLMLVSVMWLLMRLNYQHIGIL